MNIAMNARRPLRERPEAWAMLCALLLIAAAMLKPSWHRIGALHSYLMVFDITQSMNVRDQRLGARVTSRLLAAKEAARQTLLDLPCGSRVGLAIFTEYRTFTLFAPVEVCANFAELSAALARIDGRMSWAGASEIAKGVSFALRARKALGEAPLLVFFTDGHEAPPLDARYRTRFADSPKEAQGVLVGVGGDRSVPIPKLGPEGQALGFWRAQEVLHEDPHNLGRDAGGRREQTKNANEHLSSLRETYLQQLAQEAGLAYLRLIDPRQASVALRSFPPAKRVPARVALDWLPASAALMLLLAVLLVPLLRSHPVAKTSALH